jgi:hypothetical protein
MLRAALAGPHEEERDREVRLELEHPHAGPIELRLEPVQWIVGRVDRSDGSPAQGAHVNLYSKAPTRNGTVYVPRFHAGSEAAVCDSAGDFRVKKPWDPDIVLQAFIPPQPGGPRLQVSTPLRVMDSRQPQVLSLRPTTGVVRLRVIDAEFGSPVFGCKLRIVGGPVFDGYLVGDSRDPASWTQELGYGNYAIPYEPTGGAPFRVKIESKKFCAIETAELTGDGREDLGPIEVQLKRLSSIHGKLVQSADGAPARSVRVHILTDPNGLATRHASQPSSSQRFAMSVNSAFTVSSEDGSFSFEGIPPGRFKLWVIDAAHCLDGDAFIEVPEAGTRYDIELKTVKPARIKGTVRTDGPVKDKVTVALEYPDKTPITRQLDADLGFDFTRLRPGTFKLTARATLESGDAVSGSASVTVQAGDSASVEIVLGSDK